MSLSLIKSITVNAQAAHTATVIFLHGLGDSGAGWEPVARKFNQDPDLTPHVKWVLPHAPARSVTANNGAIMPAWYNIFSFSATSTRREDDEGALESRAALNALIEAEIDAGVSADQIVIGGFSQGGSMSLVTGLTSERKLGGVIALSSRIAFSRDAFKEMVPEHAREVPIFWGHGTADGMIKYSVAQDCAEFLVKEVGIPEASANASSFTSTESAETLEPAAKPRGLLFRSYDGLGHSSHPMELADMGNWLKRVLPAE